MRRRRTRRGRRGRRKGQQQQEEEEKEQAAETVTTQENEEQRGHDNDLALTKVPPHMQVDVHMWRSASHTHDHSHMFGVTMPVEIVLYTMSFLTARDLAAVAPVSSHCRALACEPELWHRLLYRDFYADPATMQALRGPSAMREYRRRVLAHREEVKRTEANMERQERAQMTQSMRTFRENNWVLCLLPAKYWKNRTAADLRHIAWCIRAVFAFAVFAIGRMFSGISAWVLKMLFLFGSYYLYNLGHLVPFLLLFIIGFVGIVAPLAAELAQAGPQWNRVLRFTDRRRMITYFGSVSAATIALNVWSPSPPLRVLWFLGRTVGSVLRVPLAMYLVFRTFRFIRAHALRGRWGSVLLISWGPLLAFEAVLYFTGYQLPDIVLWHFAILLGRLVAAFFLVVGIIAGVATLCARSRPRSQRSALFIAPAAFAGLAIVELLAYGTGVSTLLSVGFWRVLVTILRGIVHVLQIMDWLALGFGTTVLIGLYLRPLAVLWFGLPARARPEPSFEIFVHIALTAFMAVSMVWWKLVGWLEVDTLAATADLFAMKTRR